MSSLIAYLQALWHISVISAPLKPCVCLARIARSTSFDTGDFLRQALNICNRELSSGRGIYINWSRHPGRKSAGSIISGLLVAPIIKTVFLADNPSISVKSWFKTLSAAPPASPMEFPRCKIFNQKTCKPNQIRVSWQTRNQNLLFVKLITWIAMESSSSKKRTHGADWRALSKISLTLASLSPNHIVSSSGPLILMKFAWHSLAIALATMFYHNQEDHKRELLWKVT